MQYDWQEDILDVTDDRPDDQVRIWRDDEQDYVFYLIAQRHVENNGEEYYADADIEIEDVIREHMNSIISIWAISVESELYDLLIEWYDGDHEKMMDRIPNAVEYNGYLYFETGYQYDWMSRDLLDGRDGVAKYEFDEFVKNHD